MFIIREETVTVPTALVDFDSIENVSNRNCGAPVPFERAAQFPTVQENDIPQPVLNTSSATH